MKRWYVIPILCVTLGVMPVLAETDVFEATRDNSLYSDNVDATNGGNPWLYVGKTQSSHSRRGLIDFDLNSIAAGSTILNVELTLTVLREGIRGATLTDTFDLHRLSNDWGEGTVNGGPQDGIGRPADPGDATWNSNFHTLSPWNTAGGDFVAQPSANAVIDFKVSQLGSPAPVSWSSNTLVADVQRWIDRPSENFGWLLKANDNNPTESARAFASREYGDITLRPQLRITYTPVPEPTPLTILVLGAALLARRNQISLIAF